MENSTVRRGLMVVVLITCTMLLLWWFAPKGEDRGGYRVTAVSAGDIITVERDGATHTVLLEGVVAPNEGECGFEESITNLGDMIGGQEVTLIADSRTSATVDAKSDTWRRYIDLSGNDIALAQITAGFATAQDGEFDRGGVYRAAGDKATPFTCN